MKAYENGTPAYFATPPVNLVRAYHASLLEITQGTTSLEERFELHRKAAQRIRNAAAELGLKLVPADSKHTANGMTAVGVIKFEVKLGFDGGMAQIYLPPGLGVADLVPRLSKRGIIITGGIHKEFKG